MLLLLGELCVERIAELLWCSHFSLENPSSQAYIPSYKSDEFSALVPPCWTKAELCSALFLANSNYVKNKELYAVLRDYLINRPTPVGLGFRPDRVRICQART